MLALTSMRRSAQRLVRRSRCIPEWTVRAGVARFSGQGAEQPPAKIDMKNELALTPKVKAVLDQILELNMVEIFELSGAIQEKFNIPDSAFATASAGPAVGAAPAAEAPKEEKKQFDVKLASFDAKQKIKVIKEVRTITGLGLREAKELVEGAPRLLKKEVKKEEAEAMIEQLKKVGAVVELE